MMKVYFVISKLCGVPEFVTPAGELVSHYSDKGSPSNLYPIGYTDKEQAEGTAALWNVWCMSPRKIFYVEEFVAV